MLQGDIELLQFANQPDLAYDMCISIAPDCETFGKYDYGTLTSGNNEFDKESDYNTHRDVKQPSVRNERYNQFEQRYFDERNQSSNLWATASHDLATVEPYWQVPNSYDYTPQYSVSTDAGKHRYLKLYIEKNIYN